MRQTLTSNCMKDSINNVVSRDVFCQADKNRELLSLELSLKTQRYLFSMKPQALSMSTARR